MKITVLGSYQTKFGELWEKSLADLILEAAVGALKDASFDKNKVQIIYIANKLAGQLSGQNHLGALLAQILDIKAPVIRVEAACASGGVAVAQACMAINSGQYDNVLVIGAEKMTDLPSNKVANGLMSAASQEEQLSGLSFVGLYALMARRYLDKYNAKLEDLALPACKNHYHASLNDKAHFSFCVDIKKIMMSPLVASPLRLLQCSPISDGAAAILLAKPKNLSKKNNGVVAITASQQASSTLSLDSRPNLTKIASSKKAADKAYHQSGVGPNDLSLLEVHDCFSIAEILALEDLGICRRGEAYLSQRNGELRIGGKRPVNVSGGLKACGHPVGATGVKQIVEIAQQLQGRTGKRQVNGARIGLSHNLGGTGGTAAVHILQR